MPIGTRDLSSMSFEEILELDLDLLYTFSQEETISLNENFQSLKHEKSNINSAMA